MKNYKNILKKDSAFNDEINFLIKGGDNLPIAKRNNVSNAAMVKAMVGPTNEMPRAEAMIQLHLRPALLVRNNKIETPDSIELRKRFLPYVGKLESRVPSVGRIEFLKIGKEYGGTGWMISEDIIVTNRHVAALMAAKKGKTITVLKNQIGDEVSGFVDFKEEYRGKNFANSEFEIPIEQVLFMTDNVKGKPDLAFIKIKRHSKLPPPIPLSDAPLKKDQSISVVGYPGFDPTGIISSSAAVEVFKDIYGVKRCSPGEVLEYERAGWYFFHDCTTLGGNSGGAVLDNETGYAVGLHFMGEVEKENYAVKASEVIKYLKKLNAQYFVGSVPKKKAVSTNAVLEAAPDSYADRKGYDKYFLGTKSKVLLPVIQKNKTSILKFKENNSAVSELKYHHFSVVMNRDRRMCFFSICNIDGQLSKRGVKRSGWKMDSRIPSKMQIIDECYGDPPKFSRGHMTRKEDPIWGDLKISKAAAADTFHVTNATPQLQPFNAPVWLALENYALENARQDEMRITVITGPIFQKDDPIKDKVRIPVEFFKIIVFIHDTKRKLCATGYIVSQSDYLKKEEFVYGEFKTYQVSIKAIEARTGIKFDKLAAADPIKGEEAVANNLSRVEDVRFF